MSPFDRSKYPPDWEAISLRIKERAGWRCECAGECGSPGHSPCGIEHGTVAQSAAVGRDGRRREYRIVLTTAHLDHVPTNCADDNLKAMCQPCHLRYDRDRHTVKAAATRLRKAAEGTEPLFVETT
jgi:hypothetical protein